MTGPPFLLLLAMLVWSVTLLAAGSLLATLVAGHSQIAVLTDIGAIVISTLSGALLPVSMMPAIARHLAPASPGYWAIGMLKAAVRGDAACLRLRRLPAAAPEPSPAQILRRVQAAVLPNLAWQPARSSGAGGRPRTGLPSPRRPR